MYQLKIKTILLSILISISALASAPRMFWQDNAGTNIYTEYPTATLNLESLLYKPIAVEPSTCNGANTGLTYYDSVLNSMLICDGVGWTSIGGGVSNWEAGKTYIIDDVVIYNDMIYQCITDNSDATFIPVNWKVVGSSTLLGLTDVNIASESILNDYDLLAWDDSSSKWIQSTRAYRLIDGIAGTAWEDGASLTINGDNVSIDIAYGDIRVVDAYTDPVTPVVSSCSIAPQNIPISAIATDGITYIYANSSCSIVQFSDRVSPSDDRDYAFLGRANHSGNLITSIADVSNTPSNHIVDTFKDFGRTYGPRNEEGNIFTFPNLFGTLINVDKTLGIVFAIGANLKTDRKNPNFFTVPACTTCSFNEYYRDGGTGFVKNNTTNFDLSKVDDDSGVLDTLGPSKWAIVPFYQTADSINLLYGQEFFNSRAAALNAVGKNVVELPDDLKPAMLRGWFLHAGSDNTVIATNIIYNESAASGGSSSVTQGLWVNIDIVADSGLSTCRNYAIIDATTGPITVTLPDVSSINDGCENAFYRSIHDVSLNTITITTTGTTQSIGDATSQNITGAGKGFSVVAKFNSPSYYFIRDDERITASPDAVTTDNATIKENFIAVYDTAAKKIKASLASVVAGVVDAVAFIGRFTEPNNFEYQKGSTALCVGGTCSYDGDEVTFTSDGSTGSYVYFPILAKPAGLADNTQFNSTFDVAASGALDNSFRCEIWNDDSIPIKSEAITQYVKGGTSQDLVIPIHWDDSLGRGLKCYSDTAVAGTTLVSNRNWFTHSAINTVIGSETMPVVTKTLSGAFTTGGADITDLTFTNLTEGKEYQVTGFISGKEAAVSNTYMGIDFRSGASDTGTIYGRDRSRTYVESAQEFIRAVSFKFTAVSGSMYANAEITTGGEFNTSTKIQLQELPNTIAGTMSTSRVDLSELQYPTYDLPTTTVTGTNWTSSEVTASYKKSNGRHFVSFQINGSYSVGVTNAILTFGGLTFATLPAPNFHPITAWNTNAGDAISFAVANGGVSTIRAVTSSAYIDWIWKGTDIEVTAIPDWATKDTTIAVPVYAPVGITYPTVTKILTIDKAGDQDISDLEFTGLEVGKEYTVEGQVDLQATATFAVVEIRSAAAGAGTLYARPKIVPAAVNLRVGQSVSFKFIAASTSMFARILGANLYGNDTREETFLQLTRSMGTGHVAEAKENIYKYAKNKIGTEVVIGNWFGDTLYQKCYELTGMTPSTVTDFDTSINNSTVELVEAVESTSGTFNKTFAYDTTSAFMKVQLRNTGLGYYAIGYANFKLCIEYTKN